MPVTTYKSIVFVLVSLIFIVSLSACEDTDDCSTNGSQFLILRSRQFNVNRAVIDFPRRFEELRVLGTDSVLYSAADTTFVYFRLPLNPGYDTTSFFIKRGARLDTLVFGYDRGPQFVSPACGIEMLYNNVFVKYSTLADSMSVIRPNVRRADVYHVEIFR